MFPALITGLTSLRDFLSRSFLVAAFLPTLMFLTINALILFVWNWPVHDWFRREVLDASALDKTVTVAILFFFVWLASYLVSALTPFWTRILEGRNWWNWLHASGVEKHLERFDEIQRRINSAVQIYVNIENNRSRWSDEIKKAMSDTVYKGGPPAQIPPGFGTTTEEQIRTLKKTAASAKTLVTYTDLNDLVAKYCLEIRARQNPPDFQGYANDIKLLSDDAYNRALQEHTRLATDRGLEFGNREDVAPTRFGNVGMSAQAFSMRAYQCNLALISSSLRRAIAKEQDTATTLENCKSQLDFFVACFWLSLFQAFGWAVTFAICGECVGAIASVLAGPAICWLLWYGAAVEQYRVLQSLLMSAVNSPLRFQVLSDLRIGLPADITEERELWRSINLAIGFGDLRPLRYQIPNQIPKT